MWYRINCGNIRYERGAVHPYAKSDLSFSKSYNNCITPCQVQQNVSVRYPISASFNVAMEVVVYIFTANGVFRSSWLHYDLGHMIT